MLYRRGIDPIVPALHGQRVVQRRDPVTDFEQAWRLQPEREAGRHIPRNLRQAPDRLQYGRYCRLGEQLERLYSLVPSDRVHLIVLDDLKADPHGEFWRLQAFLGVEPQRRDEFPVVDPSRRPRWPRAAQLLQPLRDWRKRCGLPQPPRIAGTLTKLISRLAPRPPFSTALKTELKQYFRDDIERLSVLLNRDLSHWLDSP